MFKKEIFRTLKEQLMAGSKDKIYNFILADGKIRGAIVHGTKMINEMRSNHDLGILETLVLGHSYLAGSLMTANLKGNDRISIQIECSGPIKGLTVEANAFGEVRGYLKQIPIPIEKPFDDLNLSPFFGAGFLTVTKYLEDAKQPFEGKIMLEYGSIAQDLANYFLTSEQIPTSFNLSIKFNKQGNVTGAGGLFLQILPEADPKIIEDLEKLITNLPSTGDAFEKGDDPKDFINNALAYYKPEFLGDYRIEFMCHCSNDKIKTMLSMLPQKVLIEIKDNGPFPVEIKCHNCNTSFNFNKIDIEDIYSKKYST